MTTARGVDRLTVGRALMGAFALCACSGVSPAAAQSATTALNAARAAMPPSINAVQPPSDYVIGPDDVLSVLFWREKDMSAEVIVRPDGKITLPLLNDIAAAGLTPDQLREKIEGQANRFVEDANATVVVKQINSRKVFITGNVEKPGPYPLTAPTTVVQLLATAGGLREFADGKKILVMRTEGGKPVVYRFNYEEVVKQKNVRQNIELKPGDTVIVP